MQDMIPRFAKASIEKALLDHGVLYLNGPRQCGKSTLAQSLAQSKVPMKYVTFDDPMQIASAMAAPDLFLEQAPRLILDEIQLVPELARAIKIKVDADRLQSGTPMGRFLLTGSANIMAVPQLANALVGRMAVQTLYPFSATEVLNISTNWIDGLLNFDLKSKSHPLSVIEIIQKATFPIVSCEKEPVQWLDFYLSTLLQRDIRSLVEVEKLSTLPLLTKVLASRAGQLINESDIGRQCQLNSVTCKNYRSLLNQVFLTFDVKPWSRNVGKRLVKSPKIYFTDTLLLTRILGLDLSNLWPNNPQVFGHIFENWIASEIQKALSLSAENASLFFYRSSDGHEVDFVIEKPNGHLVAIEVKCSTTLTNKDFQGLKKFADLCGSDFKGGIVIYLGKDRLPFGNNLRAIPLEQLFSL